MMSLWDALRMNMMISYQELVRTFPSSLWFIVCTTPVRSPGSNGMAESFVKTFKRDYVYVDDLLDAV